MYDLSAPDSAIFLTETASLEPGVTSADVQFRHRSPRGGSEQLANVLFCDGHVSLASRQQLVEDPQATEPVGELAPVSWAPYVGAPAPR